MAEITLFTKKDIPGFVEFRHKSKKESPFLNDSNVELATDQQSEYSTDDKKAYLLKDKGNIIGQLFIKYHPKTNTVGLGLISVLQEYQGKGYAKKLLALVDQYAKEKKAKEIELYVDKANDTAMKVYEKMGYKKLKDHGKNRIVYIKPLGTNLILENQKNSLHVYLDW